MRSLSHVPTFENGWICRECWSANREEDLRCYRCHAVPKRREMPEPMTVSPAAEKPPEERRRVTRLTASAPPPAEPPAPVSTPAPVLTPAPKQELEFLAQLRAWSAAVGARVRRLWGLIRSVPGAPGSAGALATARVRAAIDRVTTSFAGAFAHRRAWMTVAWLVSALSCALLLSAALDGPFAASLVVVASVAIFSGLTAAITTNALERQGRSAGAQERLPNARGLRARGAVPPVEHAAQPGEVLGSRSAR